MFCTLKRSKNDDESYAFQMNDPPFSKSKGRFSVVACINCRASKTKCTSEPEGCQRCRSKNRPCQYPTMRSRRSSGDRHEKNSQPSTAAPTPQRIPSPEPIPEIDVPAPVPKELHDVDMSFEDSLTNSLTPPDSISTLTDTINTDPTFMDMMTESPDFTVTDPEADQWYNLMGVTDFDTTSLMTCQTTSPANLMAFPGSEQSCSCFTRVANVFEAAEVNLVWVSKGHARDAVDVLQQQKRIIAECEQLLNCPACARQSGFVMLLISLCEKLVCSLEDASRELHLGQHNAGRHRRHDSLVFNVSNVANQQLDDDDHRAVLVSLSHQRVAKVHSLIGAIEKLALEQRWQPHRDMVQGLKNRIMHIDI